jgi:hypothetical protein
MLFLRQLLDRRDDVRSCKVILLCRRMRHEIVSDLFYGNMLTAPGGLPQPADCKIMQDREHPGAGVIILAPVPMRDHPLKAVLHKIVGSNRVVDKTAGLASHCRDHRFDL